MKSVIIASNNAHKAEEIRAILDLDGWEFATLREAGVMSDPAEDGTTFEENARIKALAAHVASGGHAVLADDSGLVVDALEGGPGVYSARYAGENATDEENNEKLLQALSGVEAEKRTARFVCTLVFIDEDGHETVATGNVEGIIAHEASGAGGFGYDPLFLPDEYGHELSFGEVPAEEKNAISHRARALRSLKQALAGLID